MDRYIPVFIKEEDMEKINNPYLPNNSVTSLLELNNGNIPGRIGEQLPKNAFGNLFRKEDEKIPGLEISGVKYRWNGQPKKIKRLYISPEFMNAQPGVPANDGSQATNEASPFSIPDFEKLNQNDFVDNGNLSIGYNKLTGRVFYPQNSTDPDYLDYLSKEGKERDRFAEHIYVKSLNSSKPINIWTNPNPQSQTTAVGQQQVPASSVPQTTQKSGGSDYDVDEVKKLQMRINEIMNALDSESKPIAVDGIIGPITRGYYNKYSNYDNVLQQYANLLR